MNARRIGLLLGLVAMVAMGSRLVGATDNYDFLSPNTGTLPVAIAGGDTISTYAVSCASAPAASGLSTLLRSAVTAGPLNSAAGRPLRYRCFQNSGNVTVSIGSSTVAASDLWILGINTNAAILPTYCTHSSAALYCAAPGGPASVNVIEETQSIP